MAFTKKEQSLLKDIQNEEKLCAENTTAQQKTPTMQS